MTTASVFKREPVVGDAIGAQFRSETVPCRIRDADECYMGVYFGYLSVGGSRWTLVSSNRRPGVWASQLSTVAILDPWGEKWVPVSELVGEKLEDRYPFDGYDGSTGPDVEWYNSLKEEPSGKETTAGDIAGTRVQDQTNTDIDHTI